MHYLKLAIRQWFREHAPAVVAVVTLACCIGANFAVFAMMDAFEALSLPFPTPNQLITMFDTPPNSGVERDGSSMVNGNERRGNIPAFTNLFNLRFGTVPIIAILKSKI
jgi:hypothetical protein